MSSLNLTAPNSGRKARMSSTRRVLITDVEKMLFDKESDYAIRWISKPWKIWFNWKKVKDHYQLQTKEESFIHNIRTNYGWRQSCDCTVKFCRCLNPKTGFWYHDELKAGKYDRMVEVPPRRKMKRLMEKKKKEIEHHIILSQEVNSKRRGSGDSLSSSDGPRPTKILRRNEDVEFEVPSNQQQHQIMTTPPRSSMNDPSDSPNSLHSDTSLTSPGSSVSIAPLVPSPSTSSVSTTSSSNSFFAGNDPSSSTSTQFSHGQKMFIPTPLQQPQQHQSSATIAAHNYLQALQNQQRLLLFLSQAGRVNPFGLTRPQLSLGNPSQNTTTNTALNSLLEAGSNTISTTAPVFRQTNGGFGNTSVQTQLPMPTITTTNAASSLPSFSFMSDSPSATTTANHHSGLDVKYELPIAKQSESFGSGIASQQYTNSILTNTNSSSTNLLSDIITRRILPQQQPRLPSLNPNLCGFGNYNNRAQQAQCGSPSSSRSSEVQFTGQTCLAARPTIESLSSSSSSSFDDTPQTDEDLDAVPSLSLGKMKIPSRESDNGDNVNGNVSMVTSGLDQYGTMTKTSVMQGRPTQNDSNWSPSSIDTSSSSSCSPNHGLGSSGLLVTSDQMNFENPDFLKDDIFIPQIHHQNFA